MVVYQILFGYVHFYGLNPEFACCNVNEHARVEFLWFQGSIIRLPQNLLLFCKAGDHEVYALSHDTSIPLKAFFTRVRAPVTQEIFRRAI
jgi:hypothetical protein